MREQKINNARKILMLIIRISLVQILSFLFLFQSFTFAKDVKSAELVKIKTREDVTQQFVLLKPENPVASIILFTGGNGRIQSGKLFGKPYIKRGDNFLVRTREKFVRHGFVVAVVDVPSDKRRGEKGINSAWRVSKKHVQDIREVVKYVKHEGGLPVFLAGTSMGSISVAMGCINIKDGIKGVVFSSSITYVEDDWPMYKDYPKGVLDLQLDKITIPAMIIAHKGDECRFSPPSSAPKLKEALIYCPKVELMLFEGGKKPKQKGCAWLSQHSYYGIEDEVVSEIAKFIKSNI